MSVVDPLSRGLAELHAEAFDAPWTAEAFSGLLTQPGMVLEAEPGGFILARVAGDEAEILTLAVRPEVRRGGIASRLVVAAAARSTSMGAQRFLLEVAEDNGAARALYDRLGFEAAGRRRRYYARPEGPAVDALLLVLNLADRLPTG
ncbi:MAG: GNAT family N-acetyltransferase [Brevundimonas sp.]|uniref:GNAT family N-acetyltransferase n=1 Tax=Brevundimonas sp. TaxID=1871086 RepID=UPI002735B491|nr:GNAT family N-acetyltransferase [Brevundimonas sp.]MDP3404753.1 GNAT family N-acetyltransferase [Brevundimonas sp.]